MGAQPDEIGLGAAEDAPPMPPLLTTVDTWRVAADARQAPRADTRRLAAERPISISFNGVAHAVMMATPADLEDFAVGFALGEGIVARAGEIADLRTHPLDPGVLLDIAIPEARMERVLTQRRAITGSSSCGICGVTALEAALPELPQAPPIGAVAAPSVFAALERLQNEQQLNRLTGAVHAAGFARADGALVAVREDVGRHNAMDKLVEALARAGIDAAEGFFITTSRVSVELVTKVLRAGGGLFVGISAPTDLAVMLARGHRLALIAPARRDAMEVVVDPQGIFDPDARPR